MIDQYNYFSAENVPGLIQWWWTTRSDIVRIDQRRGQRGIVLHNQASFPFICGSRKMEKHGLVMRGSVQGWPSRKACSVCQWVSERIGQSRAVNDYCYLLNSGFARTRLQIFCSYSYRANEELLILQMFSLELCQWRRLAKVFFHEGFPIYGIAF